MKTGDRLFAYSKGNGYVGYGVVTKERTLAADYIPEGQKKPLPELPLLSKVRDEQKREKAEYAIGVHWLETVPLEEAKRFPGVFANPNVVCKLRDQATLEFLQREFKTAEHEVM